LFWGRDGKPALDCAATLQTHISDAGFAMNARSYLFVPADRPERYAKALAAGADAVVVDLEDAVSIADKVAARDVLANWLSETEARVVVRINSADSEWFEGDLTLLKLAGVSAVMLPKAERTDDLARVSQAANGLPLLPLIETALGMANATSIAMASAVLRLAFGSIDFQVNLGITGDDDELLAFRSHLVLASKLGGLASPIDGVSTAIDDAERVHADALRARRLGFGAKLCIHPRQLAPVHLAFLPTKDEINWAKRVVEAAAAATGAAVAVDGKMVDRPVMLRAQLILEAAKPR
jgi:citrate lyase subunit beta/citryl-CoA lyase